MSLASSFPENDRSGLSCNRYAALITSLTIKACLRCVQLTGKSSQAPLPNLSCTDGVVTPFVFSRLSELDDQLGVSSVLNPTPFTIGEPTHTSVLRWAPLWHHRDQHPRSPELSSGSGCSSRAHPHEAPHRHSVHVYHDGCVHFRATEPLWIAHTRQEPNCCQRAPVFPFPCSCRVPRAVRGSLQPPETVSGGSLASGGRFDTRRSQRFTAQMCVFHGH